MRARLSMVLTALTLVAALALPGRVAAQQHRDAPYPYILIDLGTFGGPNSYFSIPSPLVNSRGTVIGLADMALVDPFAPTNCFNPDCFVSPAFSWRHGVLTNLGALPGSNNSVPNWISPNGLIVGDSENGTIDPLTGLPELHAVLWADGQIHDLGTLGGTWSLANAVNDRGQVAGVATTAIPDPFAASLGIPNFGGLGATQNRAVLWQDGQIHDLGTLGGTDAEAATLNARGQVAGWSTTSAISNATTGLPTVDPFFWDHGRMQDLGTLGGTFGFPFAMNNRGEVAGTSDLAGDRTFHPFLWAHGQLTDLGTLGGDNGQAFWMNDGGDVVGEADVPGSQAHHGFLWTQGTMTDLGVTSGAPCSNAYGLNAQGQIVGDITDCHEPLAGVLWDHGAIHDLNSLIAPPASGLHVVEARNINERGEIVATADFPNGNEHLVLLVPTGEDDGVGVPQVAAAPAAGSSAAVTPSRPAACAPLPLWHARVTRGRHLPCLGG